MAAVANGQRPLSWHAGGWFGSQLGGTLWLLILGVFLIPQEQLAASVCIGSCVALNVWGLYLWRCRLHLTPYVGIQRFLAAEAVVVALVVWTVNWRGVSKPPPPGSLVSVYLPYWAVAIVPAVMLFLWFQEWGRRRNRS